MRWIIYVFVAIEAALVACNFIEPLEQSVFGKDANAAALTFIKFQLVVIVFYLVLRIPLEKRELQNELKPLTNKFDVLHDKIIRSVAEPLKQEDFYKRFVADLNNAEGAADLTHLDVEPPPDDPVQRNTETARYYSRFAKLVKDHEQIHFRRVERCSPEKLNWVRHLVEQLGDAGNFSLAFLDTTSHQAKLPEVSVQIIDMRKTYLVAVARHSDARSFRDVVIDDPNIARLWVSYYEDLLWSRSMMLVDKGRVIPGALERYVERAERMRPHEGAY